MKYPDKKDFEQWWNKQEKERPKLKITLPAKILLDLSDKDLKGIVSSKQIEYTILSNEEDSVELKKRIDNL